MSEPKIKKIKENHKKSSEEGNNNSSSDEFSSRRFVFTINNYSENQKIKLLEFNKKFAKKFIHGYEVGEQGTPHIQAFAEYKTTVKRQRIKNAVGGEFYCDGAKGTTEQNLIYCSKSGKYDTNCHMHDIKDREKYLNAVLRPWQQKMYDKIMDSIGDDRKMIWLWEPTGNIGKSFLIKYMCYKHEDIMTKSGGKTADIAYQMVSFKASKGWSPRVVFANMTRSDYSHVNYAALEDLKDGHFPSGKFESCQYIAATSLVVICANCEPDYNAVSQDRWEVINLQEEKEETITDYEGYY